MRTFLTSWRLTSRVAPGILAILVACTAAQAQNRPRDQAGNATSQAVAAAPADAPNARMVALVRSGGTVILSKGVKSVTRIDAGVYCIEPEASTGIDPLTAVATVSVEFYYSQLNEVMVQWARLKHGCGNNRFAVYTLADLNLSGRYLASNRVGFVISVP